jgi:hypothetical protein
MNLYIYTTYPEAEIESEEHHEGVEFLHSETSWQLSSLEMVLLQGASYSLPFCKLNESVDRLRCGLDCCRWAADESRDKS